MKGRQTRRSELSKVKKLMKWTCMCSQTLLIQTHCFFLSYKRTLIPSHICMSCSIQWLLSMCHRHYLIPTKFLWGEYSIIISIYICKWGWEQLCGIKTKKACLASLHGLQCPSSVISSRVFATTLNSWKFSFFICKLWTIGMPNTKNWHKYFMSKYVEAMKSTQRDTSGHKGGFHKC